MRFFALLLLPALLLAQSTTSTRRSIRASGEGEVSILPDQSRITVAVVTRGSTAQEAAEANATRTNAVIAALRPLIGTAGQLQTIGYNIIPLREGNPPRDAGFQVSNSLRVTSNNLAITGTLIDTAVAAGATRVDSLVLGMRDDEPTRLQALRAAGQIARARAEAIATGLGVRLGSVLSAEQGFYGNPIPVGVARVATPIEIGTLTISALVSVEYEILP